MLSSVGHRSYTIGSRPMSVCLVCSSMWNFSLGKAIYPVLGMNTGKRILDDRQEREAVLLYLCGLGKPYVAERFRISEATITIGILKNRSPKLKDPLIEYFREILHNPVYGKWTDKLYRNSALVYLAFNDRKPEGYKLVDREEHASLYDAVEERIYRPMTERLKESVRTDIPKSSNAFEIFLESLFGDRTEEDIDQAAVEESISSAFGEDGCAERLLAESVLLEYRKEKRFSLDRVFESAKSRVIEKIKRDEIGITGGKQGVIEEVLDRLPERQRRVIVDKYCLDGEEPRPVISISERYGITNRGFWHIFRQGTKRLKLLPASIELRQAYKLILDRGFLDSLREARLSIVPQTEVRLFHMSPRLRACCVRLGLKTLGELASKTRKELLAERNFDKKSLEEAERLLSYANLELREYSNDD